MQLTMFNTTIWISLLLMHLLTKWDITFYLYPLILLYVWAMAEVVGSAHIKQIKFGISQGLIYGYKYNEMLFYQDIITIRCYKNNKVRHHILSLPPHIIFWILFGQIKGMMYLCKWYSASRHNCSSEFGKSSSRFALSLHIETNIYRKWLNRQIIICYIVVGMVVW